jgi:hypothetical protein
MSRVVYVPRCAWLIASAIALTACTFQMSTGGPLRAGGDPSAVCTVQSDQGSAVFGNVVTNDGEEMLTITGAVLVDANNLEIREVYVMPIDETHSFVIGTGSTHPTEPEAIAAWDSAQKLIDYELSAGQQVNIVLAVDNGSADIGTSRAVRFTYEQGLEQFTAQTNMTLELADAHC